MNEKNVNKYIVSLLEFEIDITKSSLKFFEYQIEVLNKQIDLLKDIEPMPLFKKRYNEWTLKLRDLYLKLNDIYAKKIEEEEWLKTVNYLLKKATKYDISS